MGELQKCSQLERITIAENLISGIDQEFESGQIDSSILQVAVYCQISVNRIVHTFNEQLNKRG